MSADIGARLALLEARVDALLRDRALLLALHGEALAAQEASAAQKLDEAAAHLDRIGSTAPRMWARRWATDTAKWLRSPPTPGIDALRDEFAFFVNRIERCLDGEWK